MKTYEGVEVQLQAYLLLALDGNECSVLGPGSSTP
jgi:hypothetical protein